MNPYAIQALTIRHKFKTLNLEMVDLNLSPPVTLPVLQALALLPISTAAYVWTNISFLLFALAGGLLLALHPDMQRRQALWFPLSAAVIDTLWMGQIYGLLLILAVGIWAAVRRGHTTIAALFLGSLIAIRPLFLVWPLLLALRGQRRIAWQSLATLGALSLLPIAIYGPPIYSEWFHALSHDNHFVFVTDIAVPPLGGWSLAAIVGAACIFAAARRHAVHIHMISIVGACLCAPLARSPGRTTCWWPIRG
jgi:hypothetical protein